MNKVSPSVILLNIFIVWVRLKSNFCFHAGVPLSVGATGGHYDVPASRSKALEADATNPNLNVYHSIESLKDNRLVDHVYDEIKHRPAHSRESG